MGSFNQGSVSSNNKLSTQGPGTIIVQDTREDLLAQMRAKGKNKGKGKNNASVV